MLIPITELVSWSGGTNGLEPEVRAAYERVPWLERKASGWFILRVLNRNPRRARVLERYGPTGAVNLARMWAMYPWILVIGLLLTVTSFFAYTAVVLAVVLLLPLELAVIWIASYRFARRGRRWRSEHGID